MPHMVSPLIQEDQKCFSHAEEKTNFNFQGYLTMRVPIMTAYRKVMQSQDDE